MQLPSDFARYTRELFGDDLWQTYTSALHCEPTVSVRMNPFKAGAAQPKASVIDGEVPWCEGGYYLRERPNFTFDPLLHAGLYYVQEASSMFICNVLRQYLSETPVKMLDLCAAPGGKSTAARAVLPAGSLLVSNEPIRQRAQILAENIMKQGSTNTIVTNNYARDIAQSGLMFDIVLADVPCSGEGMFRKDEGAIAEWSLGNVDKCWRLQREIITDVWPSLREGGILIYSTCTFNTKENEENLNYIAETLGAEVLTVDTKEDWGVCGSLLADYHKPIYRFIPGKVRGEGLFMAVLRKCHYHAPIVPLSRSNSATIKRQKCHFQTPKVPLTAWLCNSDSYELLENNNSIIAIPRRWLADYELAQRNLRILSAGVKLGDVKGKDVVPAQQLALSVALRRDAFPSVNLSYADAVNYLRREQVVLPEGTPRGFVLAKYKDQPLGFMKNIGNRANNLYPAEWKIRSGYTPEGLCEVLD